MIKQVNNPSLSARKVNPTFVLGLLHGCFGGLRGTSMNQKPIVLIVDDDPGVLQVTRLLLTEDGFEVIEAASGKEVMKMFEAAPELRIDAMIVDVVMPGMHGLDVFEKVQELRPGMPVLFMTGYGENTPSVSDIMGHKLALIRKPFTAVQLISYVQKILARTEEIGFATDRSKPAR